MTEEPKGGWPPKRFINQEHVHNLEASSWLELLEAPSLVAPGIYYSYISELEAEALAESRAREAVDAAIEKLWTELNKWRPTLHFCQEWDGLPIENGEPEFEVCRCGPFPLKYKKAQQSRESGAGK